MEYNFKSKDELIKFIQEEIINTKEVTQILGCSRHDLSDLNNISFLILLYIFLVTTGHIGPVTQREECSNY